MSYTTSAIDILVASDPASSNAREESAVINTTKTFVQTCSFLRENSCGSDKVIETSFGRRKLIYDGNCGRSLKCIEDFICAHVLPMYGELGSAGKSFLGSSVGLQSSCFVRESTESVRKYFNCLDSSQTDSSTAVLFYGNGASGACSLFISLLAQLEWNIPTVAHPDNNTDSKEDDKKNNNNNNKTPPQSSDIKTKVSRTRFVLFVVDSSVDHCIFSIIQSLCKTNGMSHADPVGSCTVRYIVTPVDAATGGLSIPALTHTLKCLATYNSCPTNSIHVAAICILSAASVSTGILLPIAKINQLVHAYNSIVVWDASTLTGHRTLDMNPDPKTPGTHIDAAFISTHNVLGGAGTPGLLMIRKSMLPGTNLSDLDLWVAAGTPNLIGVVRTGLAYRIASLVPQAFVSVTELEFLSFIIEKLHRNKKVQLIGPVNCPQVFTGVVSLEDAQSNMQIIENALGIRKCTVSFLIKYGNSLVEDETAKEWPALGEIEFDPEADGTEGSSATDGARCFVKSYASRRYKGGLYLHHGFIVALLNDLFGVQACACTPSSLSSMSQECYFLGLCSADSAKIQTCIDSSGCEVFRPGYVRVSLNYSMSWDEVETVASAILWIADFGWKLLPLYNFDSKTGDWYQRLTPRLNYRKRLADFRFRQSGTSITSIDTQDFTSSAETAEKSDVKPSVKRDPRKLAGAVALPGFAAAAQELTSTLALRRAGLKKSGTSCIPPPAVSPPAEPAQETGLAAVLKLRRAAVDAKTAPPAENSEETIQDKPAQSPVQQTATEEPKPASATVTIPELKTSSADPPPASATETTNPSAVGETTLCSVATTAPPSVAEITPTAKEKVVEQPVKPEVVEKPVIVAPEAPIDPMAYTVSDFHRDEVPESVGEFYDAANRFIDSLTHKVIHDEYWEKRLQSLKKTGMSPPIPKEWAEFIWFALPGDAAFSMKLFEPLESIPKGFEPLPEIFEATSTSLSYVVFSSLSENQQAVPKRAPNSFFEARYFPPKGLVQMQSIEKCISSSSVLGSSDDNADPTMAVLTMFGEMKCTDKDTESPACNNNSDLKDVEVKQ